jgi:hypothetical protein
VVHELRIRDIPTIQKMLADAKLLTVVGRWIPRLNPLLKLIGIDLSEAEELLAKHGDFAKQALELAAIPDRFNDLFASRGWIVHGALNVEVAKVAITAAEAGDFETADAALADSYTVDWVRVFLMGLQAIEAFAPRRRLAELALIDYGAGRYHACIPVVLALLDGFVNDLGERGFHAEGTDLSAWDSVVGHEKGLKQLHATMMQTRKKTRTESISIPYRHGIMHGMDLGYDNKVVAAKAWAALFAVGEWARTDKVAPPPKPKITWGELFSKLRDNAQLKRRLEEWKPRTIVVGAHVPASGPETAYGETTPERALVRFLIAWKARNYGAMTEFVWGRIRDRESTGKLAGDLRASFDDVRIHDFELVEIRDQAGAATHVRVKCKGEVVDQGPFDCEIEFRLFLEGDEGQLALAGDAGKWTIPMLFDSPRRIRATLPSNDEE